MGNLHRTYTVIQYPYSNVNYLVRLPKEEILYTVRETESRSSGYNDAPRDPSADLLTNREAPLVKHPCLESENCQLEVRQLVRQRGLQFSRRN
jgi:hypothetical protein